MHCLLNTITRPLSRPNTYTSQNVGNISWPTTNALIADTFTMKMKVANAKVTRRVHIGASCPTISPAPIASCEKSQILSPSTQGLAINRRKRKSRLNNRGNFTCTRNTVALPVVSITTKRRAGPTRAFRPAPAGKTFPMIGPAPIVLHQNRILHCANDKNRRLYLRNESLRGRLIPP